MGDEWLSLNGTYIYSVPYVFIYPHTCYMDIANAVNQTCHMYNLNDIAYGRHRHAMWAMLFTEDTAVVSDVHAVATRMQTICRQLIYDVYVRYNIANPRTI